MPAGVGLEAERGGVVGTKHVIKSGFLGSSEKALVKIRPLCAHSSSIGMHGNSRGVARDLSCIIAVHLVVERHFFRDALKVVMRKKVVPNCYLR